MFLMTKFILTIVILSMNFCLGAERACAADKALRTPKPGKIPHLHVALCAIFQNDAPYLKEWIEFHKIQGIEHFYLYNNNSSDGYKKVLSPYIANHEVTLVDWPYRHDHANVSQWNEIQMDAYNHCLQHYGKQADWMAFIDTDEFLFSPSGSKLNTFLNKYKNFGGVCANWLMFGTSSVYDLSENELLIERLIHCAVPNHPTNAHVKSIVQPRHVSAFRNPHFALYHPGQTAVETDFTPINGPFSSTIKLDDLRVNHYWMRTERYLRETKIPRRNHMCGEDPAALLNLIDELNKDVDAAILQFVPELKKKMKLSNCTIQESCSKRVLQVSTALISRYA